MSGTEPIDEDLQGLVIQIQGTYAADNLRRSMPAPRVPDETLAQILRGGMVSHLSLHRPEPEPQDDLQELRRELADLTERVESLEEPEPKVKPEPQQLAPWVEYPTGPGEEVVLRWPDKFSASMHLTDTPPRFLFNGDWFDRVDDPDTGRFLGLYVQRPSSKENQR